MILKLYTIHDQRTGYMPPTADQNNAAAIRNFEHACKNVQSLFFSHPADYDLCCIGEFDTDTGDAVFHAPEPLVCASDFVKVGESE